jgi:hypothetical protein
LPLVRALLPTTLTALAAAATLAACGGDDTLSAADYRAEAKSICEQADQATEAVKVPTKPTAEAISTYFRDLLEPNEQATSRFAELAPPEELEAAHDEILQVNRAGAKVVRSVISDVDQGKDPVTVLQSATTELRTLNGRAQAAAGKLGVPACADE